MLKYLREQEVPGATVLHTVAGFTGHSRVNSTLVDAGGQLPLVLTFIDAEEHVNRVLPHIKEMAPHRLIVSEKVVLESGESE
jgi:PII-like signaling protein